MSISSRITETVDFWAGWWGDRLKSFLAHVIGWGLELVLDVIGKKAAPKLKPLIEKVEATGEVPPELQTLLNEIKNPTGEIGAMLAQSAGSAIIGGSIGKIIDAILLPLAYAINRQTRHVILNEQQLVALRRRHLLSPEDLDKFLSFLGLNKGHADLLYKLSEARLNPETVAKLWVRDKVSYEYYWNDLEDQGITPDRIKLFKELAHAIPTVQEVVHFMAKEAFEEDAVTKYGLDNEFERIDLKWFEQAGIRPEVAKLYWRSHWVHPAWKEMTELLHRGEVSPDDVYEWYRLVEIPPHWRDKLTSISWDLPNRIELRMMARYGLVDKAFLVKQLGLVGLREDFRDVAADMMLAMGIRTDLSTRYSKGWLNAEGVKAELVVSGLSQETQDRMYMWIVKNVSGERVTKERDLTLTDIYKGIKKGTVTREQGRTLIKDMGYDDWEVEVKLANNVPEEETVVEVKQRELTKTDILKLFKAKEIDEPETLTRLMTAIRLSEGDSLLLINLAKQVAEIVVDKKKRELTKTDILKLFKVKRIDETEALARLMAEYSEGDSLLLISLVEQTTEVIIDEKQRELTKTDIIKAIKAGVLTHDEGFAMLLNIGYTEKDAKIIFETRIEIEEPITEVRQRELTKIDIIKAVKAGVVTQEEGYIMMLDIGYIPKDAEIIFQTRIEAVAGSPDTFNEFKRMTQIYRASQGMTIVEIPDELIMAEREVKIAEVALRQGKAIKVRSKRLGELERAFEDAKIAYHQLVNPPEVEPSQP